MTWHLFEPENFECSVCAAEFIPFEVPQKCPQCGSLSVVPTSFLADVVSGLRIHKNELGSYVSAAYFVGSLAESIFYWCCQMLDAASEGQTKMPNIESVQRHLDTIDWGDHGYMKVYFSALLGHVLEQL